MPQSRQKPLIFAVTLLLVLANCGVLISDAQGRFESALVNDRVLVAHGELYRLLSCGLVHVDRVHFLTDLVYWYAVASVAMELVGARRMFVALTLCQVAGACVYVVFGSRTDYECGASNAVHGLCAASLMYILRTTKQWALIIAAAAAVGYLFYLSVFGIVSGRMPWPFARFGNEGWGHLGAVAMGCSISVCAWWPSRRCVDNILTV
jgi:membrane associated rhomboid family serine protease